MTVQPDLFGGVTDAGATLTHRQQQILALVLAQATTEADEVGALTHSLKTGRWAHPPDERCDFCSRDGRQALEPLIRKGLVRRRRGGGRVYYEAATDVGRTSDVPGPGDLPDGF